MGILTEVIALFEPTSPHRTTAFSVLFVLASAAGYLLFLQPYEQEIKLPFAGVKSTSFISLFLGRFKFIANAHGMIDEGYMQYKAHGQAFQVPTYSNNRVILSAKHVEELRNSPDSKLSLAAASYEFMYGKLIGMEILNEEGAPHTRVTRKELTQNLARLIDPISEETRFAVNAEFPEANDWTPVAVNKAVLPLVARISGRVFVGLPFCRNEEWLETSAKFTEDMFANSFLITLLPRITRPLASLILPYRRRITRHKQIARKYLAPIYAERIAEEKVEGAEKPKQDDIYTWMLGQAKPKLRTPEILADFQLLLSMAAIHTTTVTLVALLYDLAARPEYIDSLREEMINVIEEDGGVLKKSTLAKMVKLDSFMKESARFNCSMLAFLRKVGSPVTLSDGTQLPTGTMVGAPLRSMLNDSAFIENPEEFDGFRWYKLRLQAEQFNSHQYVSTSASSLFFGHGNHACPGRFFAANEVQIVLTHLLLRYDIKYPEGETRPRNWYLAEFAAQNTRRKLLFKKRENIPRFEFL